MKKLIMGNWKMNGLSSELGAISALAGLSALYPKVRSGLCLPATLLPLAVRDNPTYQLGGQDCHMNEAGAHTGCISARMLVDAGAKSVIVGHSERRADQHESDADIQGKARSAKAAGLQAIICIGETEEERDAGKAEEVVLGQLSGSMPTDIGTDNLVVAYEPVWAIGTGRIPSSEDVAAMHLAIREKLIALFGDAGNDIAVLYGGSMNGGNAEELLAIPNVDGGLIGGASLSAEKFEPILAAAEKV